MIKVLFLGCHCDDIELGCGGTIHKRHKEWDIYCLNLCCVGIKNEKYYNLRKTSICSFKNLGLKEKNIFICDFKPNNYEKQRVEISNTLKSIKNLIAPNLIISQIEDDHQDHTTLYKESIRIFRDSNLYFYLSTNISKKNFEANLYETLSEKNLEKKWKSIKMYKKKLGDKIFFNKKTILSRACSEATYVRKKYVETYSIYNKIDF